MLKVAYATSFIRQMNTIPEDFHDDILQKVELFKDPKNHKSLNVHKLKGRLKGRYSFKVSYDMRIVFQYNPEYKKEAILLSVGDHDVYKH